MYFASMAAGSLVEPTEKYQLQHDSVWFCSMCKWLPLGGFSLSPSPFLVSPQYNSQRCHCLSRSWLLDPRNAALLIFLPGLLIFLPLPKAPRHLIPSEWRGRNPQRPHWCYMTPLPDVGQTSFISMTKNATAFKNRVIGPRSIVLFTWSWIIKQIE